ncbi:MAG: hypothetical protein ACHP9V_07640 [Terriglobales bacterium]
MAAMSGSGSGCLDGANRRNDFIWTEKFILSIAAQNGEFHSLHYQCPLRGWRETIAFSQAIRGRLSWRPLSFQAKPTMSLIGT